MLFKSILCNGKSYTYLKTIRLLFIILFTFTCESESKSKLRTIKNPIFIRASSLDVPQSPLNENLAQFNMSEDGLQKFKTMQSKKEGELNWKNGSPVELKSENLALEIGPKYCQCVPAAYCTGSKKIRQKRAVNAPNCRDNYVMCCSVPNPTCGRVEKFPNFYPSPRYGEADFGEYPWTALIMDAGSTDLIYGSGVLISGNIVLTTARNLQAYLGRRFKVRLGEWNLASSDEPFEPLEFYVTSQIIHPDYNERTFQNDVMLLRLNTTIDFLAAPHIRPACLPRPGDAYKYTNAKCVSAGWGQKPDVRIVNSGRNILKEVDLQLLESGVCQYAIRRAIENPDYFWDMESFLCAGGLGGKGLCKGDEGMGLICQERAGVGFTVVGMSTWGNSCGTQGFPNVFINLETHFKWISSYDTSLFSS